MTPKRKRILIVEDEPAIAELLDIHLRHAGFESEIAQDAQGARAAVFERSPDLVLLDWMLPGMTGEALVKLWRSQTETKHLPIIMLTARADEADKLTGLNSGADDYVTKPFSTKELIARIHAVLTRSARTNVGQQALGLIESESSRVKSVGLITLDRQAKQAKVGQVAIALSPTEWRLLEVLMQNAGAAMSREALLRLVWRNEADAIDARTVDVQIKRIRQAIATASATAAEQLATVRGLGYRLSAS